MEIINREPMPEQSHLVNIYPRQFQEQPTNATMGWLTNQLKRRKSEYMGLSTILNLFSTGYCGILAQVTQGLTFISSDLFAIDVDDIEKITDPKRTFEESGACGLFYTFSHGKNGKGNRYRLVFRLDAPITNEDHFKAIVQYTADALHRKGIPTDTGAVNPRTPIRGGKSGDYFINEQKRLPSIELLTRIKEQSRARQQRLYDQAQKEFRPIPWDQLKKMAESIGYIPSGVGDYKKWMQVAYAIKIYEEQLFISYEQGYELFHIISGPEAAESTYRSLKPRGQVNIGTFIHHAIEGGYEGKYNYYPETKEAARNYKKIDLRVNRYIPKETARDLLQKESRILADSPTGSGKTESFVTACQDLAERENHFYIFAAPTIALTQQIAKKYQVQAVFGSVDKLFKNIYRYVRADGKKVFVSTYDMAPRLIEFLKEIEPSRRFTLVVDEYHKFVTDYSKEYRYRVIKELYEISQEAKTFVALSGTTDEIDKNDFDEVFYIKNGHEAAPITSYAVYTYEKKKDGLAELITLLETNSKHRKLLVYIQSLDAIEKIYRVLRKRGIEARKVTADTKKNATYRDIVDKEEIDEAAQVILTTSVIADGINIQNKVRFEVIAVCNDFSDLFNPSLIKQISHRLRNHYDQFSLFIQEQKQEDKGDFFSIESAYRYKRRIVTNMTDELNQDPFFDPFLFHRSIIENRYGLYYDEQQKEVSYDPLYLRHATSKEQHYYYRANRDSFTKAVEKILHAPNLRVLNVTQEIQNHTLAVSLFQNIEAAIVEEEVEPGDKTIESLFTKTIYQAFQKEDAERLEAFEKLVEPRHFSHLKQTCQVAPFELCHHLVKQVKRDADTHSFMNDTRALNDIFYFEAVNRNTPTKKVLAACLGMTEFVPTEEFQDQIGKLAKKLKVTKKDIKAIERMLNVERKMMEHENIRCKRVNGTITIDQIARIYRIEAAQLEDIMLNTAKQNPKKAFYKAIESKINRRHPQEPDALF